MDPQTRVMLEEVVLVASEVEAETGAWLSDTTGVYIGCMYQEYVMLMVGCGHKISPGLCTGSGLSYLVGRVSYTFGFQVSKGRKRGWLERTGRGTCGC
jgi:acyl transferase domain-containing protein